MGWLLPLLSGKKILLLPPSLPPQLLLHLISMIQSSKLIALPAPSRIADIVFMAMHPTTQRTSQEEAKEKGRSCRGKQKRKLESFGIWPKRATSRV